MKIRHFQLYILTILTVPVLFMTEAYADVAAEMAKKIQNPLASIKAIMTF